MTQLDQEYDRVLQKILSEGVDDGDRTGTGTRKIIGEQVRFEASAENFPILTKKRIVWNSLWTELVWFIQGQTNVEFLHDHDVHIWDQWQKPYTLDRNLVSVKPIQKEYVEYEGSFNHNIQADYGSQKEKLAGIWKNMMKRCYKEENHNHEYYKSTSVCKRWHNPENFIEDVKEIPHWQYKKNNWNKFELDKDYYGSNQYSPETCVWLSSRENKFYSKSTNPISVKTPKGKEKLYLTLKRASKDLGITHSSLHRFVNEGMPDIVKGNNRNFIGWNFDYKKFENKLLRLELIEDGDVGPIYGKQWRDWNGTDQLQEVVNGLRNNPTSRRHIVSAWNVDDIPNMSLPPCHAFFQFVSKPQEINDNRKLDIVVTQRSVDAMLGMPFNWSSYATLLILISEITGHEPGEVIWNGGDVHLYQNHFEQARKVIELDKTYEAPRLEIENIQSLDDIQHSTVNLVDYECGPFIKAPVAV